MRGMTTRGGRAIAVLWGLTAVACSDTRDDAADLGAADAAVDVPMGVAALPRSGQVAACERLIAAIQALIPPYALAECSEAARTTEVCTMARNECLPGKQEQLDEVWRQYDCPGKPGDVTAGCNASVEEFDACLAALTEAYVDLATRATCDSDEPSIAPRPALCTALGDRCPNLSEFALE